MAFLRHKIRMDQPQKIKILHVAATSTGGVGQVILDLVKHRNKNTFDTSVAFGAGYWLDREFLTLENQTHILPLTRKISICGAIGSIAFLYRLIKKERYDIVHSHTSIGGLVGRIAGWLAGVPVVIFHIHSLASHPHQNTWKRKFYWCIERLLDMVTDHYISVSEHYKQMGCKSGLFAASKVDTIANGLGTPPLSKKDKVVMRAQLREQLALSPQSFVVGSVTRLEPQKAVDVLIEGFSLFAQRNPNAHLLIAGDGYLRNDLEMLSQKLKIRKQVHFLGWREDVRDLLTVFDVFALSSRWEGLPIAILEAMSCHCPVVSTAIGGVPEIIESEYNGLLIPDGDAVSLGKALLRIFQDQTFSARLAEKAFLHFEKKFSIERMVHEHEALYRRLLCMAPAQNR